MLISKVAKMENCHNLSKALVYKSLKNYLNCVESRLMYSLVIVISHLKSSDFKLFFYISLINNKIGYF